MSNNGISVAMGEVYTYAKLQEKGNNPINIDLRGSMYTAGMTNSLAEAMMMQGDVKAALNSPGKPNIQQTQNTNKIGTVKNSNNETYSSSGNSNKSTEKTYTLNSSKPNWNFKSETSQTAVKNSEGNYTLGRGNEWNFDTKYNIPYTETGNKGQGLVSVPKYNAVTNDYSRNYDVFYRTISEKHYY